MQIEINIPDEVIIQTMQGVINLFLIPKFVSLGMNATGQWINSLEPRAVNGVGEIWGMDYTYWLANGRKPGKAPPIAPLVSWVNAKFGIGGVEARGIAFAIAQKIKKEGTDYYPEGTDLLEILNSPDVLNYIYKQYEQGITVQVNNALKKMIDGNFA